MTSLVGEFLLGNLLAVFFIRQYLPVILWILHKLVRKWPMCANISRLGPIYVKTKVSEGSTGISKNNISYFFSRRWNFLSNRPENPEWSWQHWFFPAQVRKEDLKEVLRKLEVFYLSALTAEPDVPKRWFKVTRHALQRKSHLCTYSFSRNCEACIPISTCLWAISIYCIYSQDTVGIGRQNIIILFWK